MAISSMDMISPPSMPRRSRPEYLICFGVHEGFHEAASFVHFRSASYRRHRHFGDANFFVLLARFLFTQPDATQLRINEDGVGNQAAFGAGRALFNYVCAQDAKVIVRNVRESRTTVDVSQSINSWSAGFQFRIHFDKTAIIRFDLCGRQI